MVVRSQSPSVRREEGPWYPHDYSDLQRALATARKQSLERLNGEGRRQRHRIPAQTRRYINERVVPHLGNVKVVSGTKGRTDVYYGGDAVIVESEESEEDELLLGDGDGHGHIVVSCGGRIAHGRLPGAPRGPQNNVGRRRH